MGRTVCRNDGGRHLGPHGCGSGEPGAEACRAAFESEDRLVISAATLAEALIVSARRNLGEEMVQLVQGLGFEVEPVTASSAREVADAYARWGKGVAPAALNFGDCFAYALAKARGAPLLSVGADFAGTDVGGVG